MRQMELGQSGLMVSKWCLGTMTYGNQTGQADAHRQIDMALDAGIDFIDTAEMYPVNPVRLETVGRSEEIIGNWVARRPAFGYHPCDQGCGPRQRQTRGAQLRFARHS